MPYAKIVENAKSSLRCKHLDIEHKDYLSKKKKEKDLF